eukprot:SAG22_NODE_5399_length_1021_cov_1.841649_2_plen_241_part_01
MNIPDLPAHQRAHSTVVPFGSGVLVLGGMWDGDGGEDGDYDEAWYFDEHQQTWEQMPSFEHARCGHTACTLPDGRVLVMAGRLSDHGSAGDLHMNPMKEECRQVQAFDPETRTWVQLAPLARGYWNAWCVALPDGRVLVGAAHNGLREVYDGHLPASIAGHDHRTRGTMDRVALMGDASEELVPKRPFSRWGIGAVLVGGRVLNFGDKAGPVTMFDDQKGRWVSIRGARLPVASIRTEDEE